MNHLFSNFKHMYIMGNYIIVFKTKNNIVDEYITITITAFNLYLYKIIKFKKLKGIILII